MESNESVLQINRCYLTRVICKSFVDWIEKSEHFFFLYKDTGTLFTSSISPIDNQFFSIIQLRFTKYLLRSVVNIRSSTHNQAAPRTQLSSQ